MTTPVARFQYPRVLSIAGSDSGGGAGIQADLKTIAALGCYGMTAVTALTAQNTQGVRAIHSVPLRMLADQIDAVLEDIGVDAVKIGMLHTADTVRTVSAECNMPILTASTPMSSTTASIWSASIFKGTAWMARTPCVFCAVSAVMAVMP